MQPAIVTPGAERTLTDVNEVGVIGSLQDSGAVLFRGFNADAQTFADFSDRFSSAFTCDPHKVVANAWNGAPGVAGQVARRLSRTAKRVRAKRWPVHDASPARFAPFTGYGLNPHNENSYLPGAFPELVWFHCSRPSAAGGSTILVDGGEMLDRLDDSAARFLRDEPIRYRTTLQTPQWQATWGVDDQSALRSLLDRQSGVSYELDEGGQLGLIFDSTQIFPRLFDGADVVRTNMLSLQPFDTVKSATAECTPDGERVPEAVLSAVLDAAKARTEVDLRAGDVIVIDNSRVLHGRMPFTDESRRIETRCAWLRDDLRPTG